MNSFALRPLNRGMIFQPANNLLEQQLVGGFARQRVQFVNNVHTVNVTVSLHDKARQQYFWAFWRSHTLNPRSFLWRLMIDDTEMKTYQCQFVANSIQVQERNGIVYRVSFSVLCKPKPVDHEFDQAIIDVWEIGNGAEMANLLEKLVNFDLPNALENLT
ncbi:MAG: hypothetical protein LWW88_12955 [Acinetobacter sp.]|uniref:hypothetical protein n=1 Tax=Acinetobacter sp. TaxID=472 RepID=UPI00258D3667|nr:hypothetical protein [Acinetobacter sp.]MCE1272436.1 hypothetical protein [Acinetobacter sp.]